MRRVWKLIIVIGIIYEEHMLSNAKERKKERKKERN